MPATTLVRQFGACFKKGMSLSDDALREAIGRYIWFHSISLRPGIASSGPKTPEILALEAAALLGPLDLSGRNVLDVGAWNGFFSFESLRRGAALALATDSFTWKHPEYRGRETVELAAAELGLPVKTLELDALDLDKVSFKVAFDVVLFLGVFYHLIDPIRVVLALRRHTRQVLVLETVHDALAIEQPSMIFYPGNELDQDPTNWWGPNPAAVYGLLRTAGFGRVFYQDHPMHAAGAPLTLRRRGVYHAFVDDAALAAIAPSPPAWLDLDAPGSLSSLILR